MFKELKGYISYCVLIILICGLLTSVSYSSLNSKKEAELILNNESVCLKNKLEYVGESIYVSYDDVKEVVASDIFKEGALKKIIITANNKIMTYTLNSSEYYTNYVVNENQGAKKYIDLQNIDYILLDELCEIYDFTSIVDKKLNKVDVVVNEFEPATLKCNREYGYICKNNKKDRVLLDKTFELNVLKDTNYYDDTCNIVSVVAENAEGQMLVYLAKHNLNFNVYEKENVYSDENEYEFKTFVQNEENIKVESSSENKYIYSVFKLTTSAGDITELYDLSAIDSNSYAMITNGFKASNYDSSVTTYVLQNIESRQKVISTIADRLKDSDAEGIVVNFRDFKVTSRDYFTQFVKELCMYLHSIDKKVIVYVPLNALYIDDQTILTYADHCIYVLYGTKSEISKTSGPDSSVSFVEESVKKLIQDNKNASKIVIEIPMYSLLWTEKDQKVIGVQYVYSSAIESYIEKNNLSPILNEQSGQMYVENIKGSVIYKMWIEDEYSINKKISIAKENKLAGISLYKKGYEYDSLKIE